MQLIFVFQNTYIEHFRVHVLCHLLLSFASFHHTVTAASGFYSTSIIPLHFNIIIVSNGYTQIEERKAFFYVLITGEKSQYRKDKVLQRKLIAIHQYLGGTQFQHQNGRSNDLPKSKIFLPFFFGGEGGKKVAIFTQRGGDSTFF